MTSKKFSLFLLSALSIAKPAQAAVCEPEPDVRHCASHVFVPRAASTDLAWIDLLTYYNRTREYPDKKYFFSSMTIYQQSTKAKEFGSAFLLGDGVNALTIAQPGADGTVNSLELGLANAAPATPFESTLTINPTRKQFTYLGNMYVNLDYWWCGLWGDFTFGVTNAEHQLRCCEVGNTSTACPGIYNVGSALAVPEYSAFYCNKCHTGKRRTGFEDVMLRLGLNWKWCDENNYGLYIVGTVPAGRSPTAQYIFEPLVGSKHWSVGVGFMGDYEWNWDGCDDTNLTFMTDFYYRFVFKREECRTFDLLPNGPFSRYLLVVDAAHLGDPFPAANVTTSRVDIQPGSTIQLWVGANYQYCDWDLEFGYNLFWRQKEQFKSSCVPLATTVGVYNLNGCGLSPVTASNATMFDSGTADAVFVPLEQTDINIDSGLAGAALTNKVYGAVSWTGCACDCFEWMAGFGASYEFTSERYRCNALQNWAIFGKWAVGF